MYIFVNNLDFSVTKSRYVAKATGGLKTAFFFKKLTNPISNPPIVPPSPPLRQKFLLKLHKKPLCMIFPEAEIMREKEDGGFYHAGKS